MRLIGASSPVVASRADHRLVDGHGPRSSYAPAQRVGVGRDRPWGQRPGALVIPVTTPSASRAFGGRPPGVAGGAETVHPNHTTVYRSIEVYIIYGPSQRPVRPPAWAHGQQRRRRC